MIPDGKAKQVKVMKQLNEGVLSQHLKTLGGTKLPPFFYFSAAEKEEVEGYPEKSTVDVHRCDEVL